MYTQEEQGGNPRKAAVSGESSLTPTQDVHPGQMLSQASYFRAPMFWQSHNHVQNSLLLTLLIHLYPIISCIVHLVYLVTALD